MGRTRMLAAAVAGGALTACGGAPSPSVAPSSNATLVGYVSNDFVGPIGGALVTVTVGASAGTTAVTDASGSFRLVYDYRTRGALEVTKDGYAPATVPIVAPPNGAVAIVLHFATAPVRLEGSYTATFVAAAACAQIPATLRTRTYAAVIQQPSQFPQSTVFDVTLSGASFAAAQQRIAGALNSFFGVVDATSVDFRISNRYEGSEIDEGVREQVAPNVLLEIHGEAKLTVGDASIIVAPMSGSFSVTDASGSHTCTSESHLLSLRRQS